MIAFYIFPRFFLTLGALVLGLMSFMLYQADKEREESHRWILHTQDVLIGISDMKESISRIGVSQLIFLMSGMNNTSRCAMSVTSASKAKLTISKA